MSSSPCVVAYARSRGGALASCGCFGTPDTPATLLHVVVDLVVRRGCRLRGGVGAVRGHDLHGARPRTTARRRAARGVGRRGLVVVPDARRARFVGGRRVGRSACRRDGDAHCDILDGTGRAHVELSRHPPFPTRIHQPVCVRRKRGGDRRRSRPRPEARHGLRCDLFVRRLTVRVWNDVLLGVHRFLLLCERGVQLLPDQHGDGGLVEGGQLVVLRRTPLLHGLQRHLPVHDRLRKRIPLLRHAVRRDELRLRSRTAAIRSWSDACSFGTANAIRTSPAWAASCAGWWHVCRLGRSIRPARPRWPSTTGRRSRTWPVGRRRHPHPRAGRRRRTVRWSPWRRVRTARGMPFSLRSGSSSPTATFPVMAMSRRPRSTSRSSAWPPPRRQGLLVRGRRRWHLHLRRCPVLRLHGRHGPQQADRGHGIDAEREWATGSWPPTVASSPSAMPCSTAPWEPPS